MSYSYDRTAAGKSFFDYLKKAEIAFLEEVAKIVNSKQRYVKARINPGISTPMMVYEGIDSSDMEIDGYASLIQVDWTTTRIVVSANSVLRGKLETDQKMKNGYLTPKLVADIIFEQIGVH